jgi:hypothetical protein
MVEPGHKMLVGKKSRRRCLGLISRSGGGLFLLPAPVGRASKGVFHTSGNFTFDEKADFVKIRQLSRTKQ